MPFDFSRHDTSNLCLALANIATATDLRALVIGIFSDSAFPMVATLGVPTYYFFTSGFVALVVFLHFLTLHGSTNRELQGPWR
ncbi:hypothetical protein NL676_031228 [Syzygium grande]|nr:hypothetical protein NL676_031228 [Syzygium grande]